jgi:O-antigen/teichoic acid export membrane protein
LTKQQVWKGAGYIYLQAISWVISGYIFWIVMSRIVTTEIIGTYSALVSFAEIFANIAILGLIEGIQRYLGKSFYEQDLKYAKVYLKASFLILSFGIVLSISIILLANEWITSIFGFDFNLIIVLILLTASSALYMLLDSVIVSSLRTKALPLIMAISSTAKLSLSIILGLLGAGILALTLGYTLFGQLLSSALFAIVIIKLFKSTSTLASQKSKDTEEASLKHAFKNILVASVVSWVPLLIPTIGSDLGTIVIYGSKGSYETAVYFIALTVVTGITGIVYSLFAIALPALSGMKDGRKTLTWQTMRLSALVSLPFSASLIFYSKEVMQILGPDYIGGALPLQLLLFSILPVIVSTGVDTLAYSYGKYRLSLGLGLAMTVPRTILYFVLVPQYGGTGAAIAYTVGSIMASAFAIIIARKIGIKLYWKDLGLPFLIPIGVAFAFDISQVHFIVGIISTVIISYIVLIKIKILTKVDVRESIQILPYNVSDPILNVLHKVDRKLKLF